MVDSNSEPVEELTLDGDDLRVEDETIVIPGVNKSSEDFIEVRCSIESIVSKTMQAKVDSLEANKTISFEATQGRASGVVTDIDDDPRRDNEERRVVGDIDESDDKFAIVQYGPDQNPAGKIGEYQPEDNRYYWLDVGALLSLDVEMSK